MANYRYAYLNDLCHQSYDFRNQIGKAFNTKQIAIAASDCMTRKFRNWPQAICDRVTNKQKFCTDGKTAVQPQFGNLF